MTLRTPRRRISPRTKQKYRAIKNFLRKALGTSSRGDTLTNSTLGVSVSDLKNKIECIEQQLDRVSKHCHDIATLEEAFRKESENLVTQENLEFDVRKPRKSSRSLKNLETNVLYKNSSNINQKHNNNDDYKKISHNAERDMNSGESIFNNAILKSKNRRNRKSGEVELDQHYERHDLNCKNDKIARAYSTRSFHLLHGPKHRDFANPGCSSHRPKQHRRKEYIEDAVPKDYRYEKYERSNKHRRNKRQVTNYDEEFIADIIERQYKPVKLFGKRHSDFSQFSAPVCRDQEFRIRHDIQEGSELCSCCYDDNRRSKHRYVRNNDLSDMRSICDTRLYSSKANRSHNKYKRYVEDYNNSAFYDVVPVKEKSSPKSRRKFADDNKMIYHFKEVPPSPRTQRPRLNLKVHNYDEYDNSLVDLRPRSGKKLASQENCKQTVNTYGSDVSSRLQQVQNRQNDNLVKLNTQKSIQIETTSSLQVDPVNILNNDTTINTQVTDLSVDKTDKTLGEIKNILQSFLIEMKKESTHDEKSNVTDRIDNKTSDNQDGTKSNGYTVPNSKHNMGNINHNMGSCGIPPFLPTFPSPCCYPIIPVCPMNCLQSGYVLPNPSFTCMACAKNSKENTCHEKGSHNNSNPSEAKTTDETQELIKQIYKFVSQKSKTSSKMDECSPKNEGSGYKMRNMENNLLTNRSVGSAKPFKHDANVGTPNMKCHSKSCEAIGSRIPSEGYTTNASYSDTVLDKLSLEASESTTESDVSTELPKKKVNDQGKQSPFKKVLRSLRLLRRKKDVIEEETENESTVEVNVKSKPPFKQHITNYSMHGQEYFHPPPIPEQVCCSPHLHKHSYSHDHRDCQNVKQHSMRNEYQNCRQFYDQLIPPHQHPKNYYPSPICTNYDPQYNQLHPPQVPLCLKEIEVKSIATQSERKMSIFHKFAKKIQPPVRQDATQQYSPPPVQNKPTLWKSLQEKAKQQNPDPMSFSMKTQKQLAQGDMKMRNAMLKKLFYKRNPFSPRNLIVKTLLGKDKSSFGDPPKMYRPRMFL